MAEKKKSAKKAQKGLGRGFDSLIPTDIIAEEFDPTASDDRAVSRHKHLLIQDVIPSEEQPRKNIDDEALADLVASIKVHGVVQPIVVVSDGKKYQIIAGERRWRAAQAAGLERIPALIRKLDDQTRLEIALIENLQREDLTPLEMATAFAKLQEQFNLNLSEISQRVGKAGSTISNTTRLLKLSDAAKRALTENKITEQHARAILALDGQPQKQQELLDLILRHKWSATRAEQFVIATKKGEKTAKESTHSAMAETKETKAISKKLEAQVRVRKMAKGGRIVIEYKDAKDLKRITDIIT